MTNDHTPHEITPVVALESRMSATERNVAAIQESIENLVHAVDRSSKGIDRLREQRTTDARPQYGIMIAIGGVAATVVLAIVGIAGSGYVRDQTRIEGDVRSITNSSLKQHIESLEWQRAHDWEVRDINARQSEQAKNNREVIKLETGHLRELIALYHGGVLDRTLTYPPEVRK